MKRCIAGIAVLLAVGVFATDMEQRARTILTCRTSNAGVAEITCDDPGEWKFSVESRAGIVRLPVPASGYAEVTWTGDVPQLKLSHDGQRACKGE